MTVDLRGKSAIVLWSGIPLWAASLTVSGEPATEGYVGDAYTAAFTADGGVAPYTYSLSGSWPTGISIDAATGLVSGTLEDEDTYTELGVLVTDDVGTPAISELFTLSVAPAPAALAIDGTPVTTATEGDPYDGFTVTASGGVGPYEYSLVGTWPSGLSVDADGLVSGTLTTSGTFTDLSVRVTDARGTTEDLATFTITVTEALGILVGFANSVGSDPTIPAHQVGDVIVAVGARTTTHGGVPPSVTIDGANPWVLWDDLVEGTDRAVAVYYMTAISTTHTVTWANATGQRPVWVFRGKVPDTIQLATYSNGTANFSYPEL